MTGKTRSNMNTLLKQKLLGKLMLIAFKTSAH